MDTVYNQIEWSEFGSTLLLPESLWNPSESDSITTVTDWSPPSDGSLPAIVQLKCLETRSHAHVNVTCSRTRSGKHYEKKESPTGTFETSYELEGKMIERGSDMVQVFDAAYQAISVR